jgi:cell shape-determining protein MreC
MDSFLGEIIAVITSLAVAPAIVFSFIYFLKKGKREIEKMKYQKEILELEIEKEKIRLKSLEEENKKLDRIIGTGETAGLLN